MSNKAWRIKMDDRDPEAVDEVVMRDAFVHLEDLGDAYMLIVENTAQHIHLTIPHPKRKLAWVMEQYATNAPEPMSNEEDRDVRSMAERTADERFPEMLLAPENEQRAEDFSDGYVAGYAAGFHRTPAPAPDVRALIHEARALVARADAWKRPGFPTEASEFMDALSDKVDRLTDALEAACATIAQLTTELDARFEHSDHTAAKYYRRMRDAEREMHARELHHFEEEQKSAGLAAVIEKMHSAGERLINSRGDEWVEIDAPEWDQILSTAPADALREHDAALIESLAARAPERRVAVGGGWTALVSSPCADWLRERARQVQEGEA